MKKITLIIIALICYVSWGSGQTTTCNDNSKVTKIIIYLNLPNGFQAGNILHVNFKNRQLLPKYDEKNKYYEVDLLPAEKVIAADIQPPPIPGLVSKESMAFFSIQMTEGICSAVFSFSYNANLVLNIDADPNTEFTIMKTKYTSQPIKLNNIPVDEVIRIKASLLKSYIYSYDYIVIDHIEELDKPVSQTAEEVQDIVISNPKNNLNFGGKKCIRRASFNTEIIYKLSTK